MIDLIHKACLGDRAAMEQALQRYGPKIHAIAYQLAGNSADAQDITQEVFLKLFRSLKKYDPRFRIDTWIYRVTVNMSIDHIRKNRRHKNISLTDMKSEPLIQESYADPVFQVERGQLKGAIARLSENLTVNQKKVFVLRDVQGLATDEVAQILKCRESTVRVHLSKARRRIRKELNERFPGWRKS